MNEFTVVNLGHKETSRESIRTVPADPESPIIGIFPWTLVKRTVPLSLVVKGTVPLTLLVVKGTVPLTLLTLCLRWLR